MQTEIINGDGSFQREQDKGGRVFKELNASLLIFKLSRSTFFLLIFRETGREGERDRDREKEKHQFMAVHLKPRYCSLLIVIEK